MESSYTCVAKCFRVIDVCDPIYYWNNILQAGIFSTIVSAFLIESHKSLKADPADVSSILLRQIAQEIVDVSNGTRLTPPTLNDKFTPPRRAIHVNILWFLSVCLSLACGLAASLVQQWLRRYIRLTQHPDVPRRRARVRIFLFEGIQAFHVGRVVENISVMLHAAIFLFFTGLVDFLFAINHEVAKVIVVVVATLAVVYFILTLLPAIFRHCPFQTPLTSVLWYMGHGLAILFLYLFSCSSRINTKIHKLQEHVRKGMDLHLMGMMADKADLDEGVLGSTLNMCLTEDELEAFVDAIPGYLQMDDKDGKSENLVVRTHIGDIEILLSNGKLSQFRHQLARLFASCTNDRRTMGEVARRRRAIICCRAIWEMSNVALSNNVEGKIGNLPVSIEASLQVLTFDSDPAIAISALMAMLIFKRALLEHYSPLKSLRVVDRSNTDPDRPNLTAAVRAKNISFRNNPLSMLSLLFKPYPAYPAQQCKDDRLNTMTEFMSRILELIPQLDKPSRLDLQETKMTLDGLCCELNGQDFPFNEQQRLANVLVRVPPAPAPAQLGSANEESRGMLCL